MPPGSFLGVRCEKKIVCLLKRNYFFKPRKGFASHGIFGVEKAQRRGTNAQGTQMLSSELSSISPQLDHQLLFTLVILRLCAAFPLANCTPA